MVARYPRGGAGEDMFIDAVGDLVTVAGSPVDRAGCRPDRSRRSAILAALLDELVRDVTAAGTATRRLVARLHEARDLAGGLDPYLERCTTPGVRRRSPALAARTATQDWTAAAGRRRWSRRCSPGTSRGRC